MSFAPQTIKETRREIGTEPANQAHKRACAPSASRRAGRGLHKRFAHFRLLFKSARQSAFLQRRLRRYPFFADFAASLLLCFLVLLFAFTQRGEAIGAPLHKSAPYKSAPYKSAPSKNISNAPFAASQTLAQKTYTGKAIAKQLASSALILKSKSAKSGKKAQYHFMPRLETNIDLTIRGPLAYSEYSERFFNPTAQKVSALYIFPLPPGVDIDHVQAHTKGQHLVSKIVARSHHLHAQSHKAERRAAAPYAASQAYWRSLTQDLSNFGTQKFFTLAVTIAPKSELAIVLHTQQTLPIEQGARQIRLPLKTAPFAQDRTRPVKQPVHIHEQPKEQTGGIRSHMLKEPVLKQRAHIMPAGLFPGSQTYSNFLHKASLRPQSKPVLHNQLSLKIDIGSAHGIEGVLSTHHKIKTTYLNAAPLNAAPLNAVPMPTGRHAAKTRLIIELAQQHVSTDKDFILSFKAPRAPALNTAKGRPAAAASLALDPIADLFYERAPLAAPGDHYLLAALQAPPYRPGQKPARRDVIFFLDRSSTLAAKRGAPNSSRLFHALKASLSKAVTELAPQDRFNIYGYNNTLTALFAGPARATKAHKNQALGFIAALKAEGPHNIMPALKAALPAARRAQIAAPAKDQAADQAQTAKLQNIKQHSDRRAIRQVVFITSQAPSAQQKQHLQNILARKPDHTRFFAIGLQQASRSAFLRQLSQNHRGTFIALASKNARAAQSDAAHVESTLNALLHKIKYPVLTNIKASWVRGAQKAARSVPLPDLYAGGEITISAALAARDLPAGALLKITGLKITGLKTAGLKITDRSANSSSDAPEHTSNSSPWQLTLTSQQAQQARGLRAFWARRKIAALAHQNASSRKIRRDIARTSLSYGVRVDAGKYGLRHSDTRFKMVSAPTPHISSYSLYAQKRGENKQSSQHYAALITPLPFAQTKSTQSAAKEKHVLLIGFVALFFATMCALTLGLWRNFRREVILMASGEVRSGRIRNGGIKHGRGRPQSQFYKKRPSWLRKLF